MLDPLTGRLVVARLGLPPDFDLPAFYRRAGLVVLGPFVPAEPRARLLPPGRALLLRRAVPGGAGCRCALCADAVRVVPGS